MKKIIFITTLAFMTIAMFSCGEFKPDFDFEANVSGYVEDTKTNIEANLNVEVKNVKQELVVSKAYSEEKKKAITNDFVNYVKEYYLKGLNEGAEYTLIIKGFVRENKTGITIPVEYTLTNK